MMIAVLIFLMVLRVPIAVAMIIAGAGGYILLAGWSPLINYLKTAAYWRFAAYELSVVPLFLLMGQFATKAGISRALFDTCNLWLGHRRGGLAMASIGACAAFGAICGSSLATASTMAQVALPDLRRHGYSVALATGTLAAGGTLGILIPPSIALVVYAILTEQNIVKMFMAAFIPGVLAALGYMIAVSLAVRLIPGSAGPAGARVPLRERVAGLGRIWHVTLIFLVVIGGIYLGWFTPTEAAAIGAFATGLLAFVHGGMRREGFLQCLYGTAETTAMIFLILFGAEIFNIFLALTQMPAEAASMIADSGLAPLAVLAVILLLYILLGCFMDSLSMILLTVPIFFPVVMALDFGLGPEGTAIWFGILAVVTVEVGLITPPVGMNVFIINKIARDVPMLESFKGVLPFLISDFVRIGVLVAFPGLTLWLVRVLS